MTYEGPGFDHECEDDSCSCHEWFAEEKDREIESLRAWVKKLEAELHALKQQAGEPVALVMQSNNDGSIGAEIAPLGWSTFAAIKDKMLQNPWIKTGAAKLVSLYLRPFIPEGEPVAWFMEKIGGNLCLCHDQRSKHLYAFAAQNTELFLEGLAKVLTEEKFYLRPSIPEGEPVARIDEIWLAYSPKVAQT